MENLKQNSITRKAGWRKAIARPLGRALLAFADFRLRAAVRAQLNDLERRGSLNDFLKDIGITRPEMERSLRGYRNTSQLLPAMARRLGIDIEKLAPASRYAIRETCSLCEVHRHCRRWVANSSTPTTAFREFCPNGARFDDALRGAPKA